MDNTPTRTVFQGMAPWECMVFYGLSLVSVGLFIWGCYRLMRRYRTGRPRGAKLDIRRVLRGTGRTLRIVLTHAWIRRGSGAVGQPDLPQKLYRRQGQRVAGRHRRGGCARRRIRHPRVPAGEKNECSNLRSRPTRQHCAQGLGGAAGARCAAELDSSGPLDFERDNVLEVLTEHGYRPDSRTFLVWEAVTQYLTPEAVHATLERLRPVASGSRLVFTYVRKDFIDGINRYGAETLYRRFRQRQHVWEFGIPPAEVATFLSGHGWRLIEQAGPDLIVQRYVTPTGRNLPASPIEWSAYAEKM